MHSKPLQRAESLETFLGDPFTQGHPYSFARAVALDEAEAFPEELVDALGRFGYLSSFVPIAEGGRLETFEEPFWLVRSLARRDLTAAIACGQSFLGSVAVWLLGSPAQKRRAGELLLNNGALALALTEEAHGSDVLASELRASPEGDGFVLNGTKWLINNGTRGAAFTVFAATEAGGGVGGCSLFFVDKDRLQGGYAPLPKKKTHGIRGADISGFSLKDCRVAQDALLGPLGGGLEAVLKGLLITRVGCSAFSLGAADSALRIALDFAQSRRLYGARVWDIPAVRVALTQSYVELVTCEALALASCRMVQSCPEQLVLASAVTKYLVPTLMGHAIRRVATVIGARHYLRDGLAQGAFQKLMRDHEVVPLFDGSTAVNLESVGLHCMRRSFTSERMEETLSSTFDLRQALPPLAPGSISVVSSGQDDVTGGLQLARERLRAEKRLGGRSEQIERICSRLERVSTELADARARIKGMDRAALKRSTTLFEAAERFCRHYAVAALAQLLAHSAGHLECAEDGLHVLDVSLGLLPNASTGEAFHEGPALNVVQEAMLRQQREDQLFSLLGLQLARRGQPPSALHPAHSSPKR
jgi:alkylation response protein AidB-like acyl-CoA dehydrogenase